MTTAQNTKPISLADFRKHGQPYPFAVEGLGVVLLRPLTHGEKHDLVERHYGDEGVKDFPALRDEVVLMALAEPKMEPQDLADLPDTFDFVGKVFREAGTRCGLLQKEDPAEKAEAQQEEVAPLDPAISS